MMSAPGKKMLIESFRKMMMIRRVEEKLMEVFSLGEIPGFIHVCIGQEATPVAVANHLTHSDYIAATHRGHGHALAKGIDLKLFMAELFGKKDGPCRGRSGSMHLADRSLGILGANGIVGGGIPIAVGSAFASRYKKTDQVTVCFFGEGATDEGTFHESLNIASMMKLPIVFVCENNGWAEFTSREVVMPVGNVADRASVYRMPGMTVPNEFMKIYEGAAVAVERARKGDGPSLLEVKSKRWYGHFVGDAQKYRPQEDIEEARKNDCIAQFEGYLMKNRILRKKDLKTINEEIRQEIDEAVEFARKSPFPEPGDLMADLYA
jgi:TPP-dependent pyruvate/acetoin dehydrogenase alpha subunit